MQHTHISGLEGIVTALYVIAIFGFINLMVKKVLESNPKNHLASSWANLWTF